MPQNIEFTAALLPSNVNPELEAAGARHLAWARSHGLVRSDAAAERSVYSQVAESAAYGFPDARGADLDLCFDLLGWFFLFDDQFDARDGRDGAALDTCDRLTDLVHGAPLPADAPPILTSFAECWERMTRGMSRTWRRRTAHDWADYLSGWPTKLADATHRRVTEPEILLLHRRRTIGVRPLLALAERVGGFEVPSPVWSSSLLEATRLATLDAIICMNEVHSVEKDKAGAHPNLALSIAWHRGISESSALDRVVGRANQAVAAFLRLREELRLLSKPLPASTRGAVERYASAEAAWIRGYHDWGQRARRYRAAGHPGDLGLENLVGG